jgi:hypothetical protein
VGTIKPIKAPELFVDLARRRPSLRFRMVGGAATSGPADKAYYERIRALASAVPNLEFVGHVPFRDVGRHFDGASLFVSTATAEGFPNTFLQAWIRGVPTASFVRPEIVPGDSGTIACADLDAVDSLISKLSGDVPAWSAASIACKAHFERVHGVASALQTYRDLFHRLARGRGRALA